MFVCRCFLFLFCFCFFLNTEKKGCAYRTNIIFHFSLFEMNFMSFKQIRNLSKVLKIQNINKIFTNQRPFVSSIFAKNFNKKYQIKPMMLITFVTLYTTSINGSTFINTHTHICTQNDWRYQNQIEKQFKNNPLICCVCRSQQNSTHCQTH